MTGYGGRDTGDGAGEGGAGAADVGGGAASGKGSGDAAVAEAGEADEPACLHLRAIRPRPDSPDRNAPLRHPHQPGLPPVRRLRLR